MTTKFRRIRQMKRKGKKVDPKFIASCYGKVQHDTYDQAKLAASQKAVTVFPYKCQFGAHYHVGKRS